MHTRLYEILKVKPDATEKEIRASYRKLSKTAHPDGGGHQAEFESLKRTFDILSDEKRRARYDATGRTDDSPVTPEAVRNMIATTVRAIVTAQRPDGTSDDPVWEDIKNKVLLTIFDGRRTINLNIAETRRKLARTQRLLDRFKPKTEFDPVGDCLRDEKRNLEREMREHEDAMEMSRELETTFAQYDYEVGPGPEGQYDPSPTLRRGTMFLGSPTRTSFGRER